MGVFWFRQGAKVLLISVCEVLTFVKIKKKINANNNFVAADAAVAA